MRPSQSAQGWLSFPPGDMVRCVFLRVLRRTGLGFGLSSLAAVVSPFPLTVPPAGHHEGSIQNACWHREAIPRLLIPSAGHPTGGVTV